MLRRAEAGRARPRQTCWRASPRDQSAHERLRARKQPIRDLPCAVSVASNVDSRDRFVFVVETSPASVRPEVSPRRRPTEGRDHG
jgi:hypothetical protein